MSDAYVIEVNGKTVGLIVRYSHQDENYRFLASLHTVNELEGRFFAGPWQAERAARDLLSQAKQPKAKSRRIENPTLFSAAAA